MEVDDCVVGFWRFISFFSLFLLKFFFNNQFEKIVYWFFQELRYKYNKKRDLDGKHLFRLKKRLKNKVIIIIIIIFRLYAWGLGLVFLNISNFIHINIIEFFSILKKEGFSKLNLQLGAIVHLVYNGTMLHFKCFKYLNEWK